MPVYAYKLKLTPAQQATIDEAIRVTQFIRNICLRLWMDEWGISANDLQTACSRLAHEFAFVAPLNSQARQAAADRTWAAISRFYANCKAQRPGKKGYPRFQRDCRSVEYKVTGWKLAPDGWHLAFTDGCGIGRVKLLGSRDLATLPLEQIKRMRLTRRADGYYALFVLQAERRVVHVPTGRVVGLDMGLHVYEMDSDGQAAANPRFIHNVEQLVRRRNQRLARKSLHHKQGKKPQQHHAARQSANWHKARGALATTYLTLQRQRADFARKPANALVSSHGLIALEDLQIRNLVRNRHLARAISDAGWAVFRHWVEYYGRVHGTPVVAVPPHYTSQVCSGCGELVRKSLSVRSHICPHCGLILDRDHNAALLIRGAGLVRAIDQGVWDASTQRVLLNGTLGHTGTSRVGTAGLLRAPAGRCEAVHCPG